MLVIRVADVVLWRCWFSMRVVVLVVGVMLLGVITILIILYLFTVGVNIRLFVVRAC